MSPRLGLELTPRAVRAVRLDGWGRARARVAEVEWDPERPAEAAAALAAQLGGGHRVAVAVDLALLYSKEVRLPPLPAAEKRRILALEPERFFPVRGEDLVVAARDEDNLVFAAREALLVPWLAALEALGAVDRVEPTPHALARALAAARVTDATVLLDGTGRGVGVIELARGRVRRARRVYGEVADAAAAVAPERAASAPLYVSPWSAASAEAAAALAAAPRALPAVAGAEPAFLPALGAALGVGRELREVLVPPELGRRIVGRRRRALALAVLAAAAALLFAGASADAVRERTARRLDARIAELRGRAAGVLALQEQVATLDRQARAAAQLAAARPDPLAALTAVSRRLPAGAYLRMARARGADWQLDGYARDAAPLVPLFEAAPEFENVRFLTATSRVRLGDTTYESFSIALRYAPAP